MPEVIYEVAQFFKSDMNRRWNWFTADPTFTLGVATLAHPYYKNKKFSSDKEYIEGSKNRFIREVFEVSGCNNNNSTDDQNSEGEISENPTKKSRLNANLEKMDMLLFDSSDEDSDSENISSRRSKRSGVKEVEIEIKSYLELNLSNEEKSVPILQWCRNNCARFPNISLLWRKYLSMPCSSAPSERVFSAVNLQFDGKGRMLIENLGKFVMHRINSNFRSKNKL